MSNNNPTGIEIKPDAYYSVTDAAFILGKSEKTLQNYRSSQRGPAFRKSGETPLYRGRDLIAYIEASVVASGPRARRSA